MKERADSNYFIELDYGEGAVHSRLFEYFSSSYWVRVNGIVDVVLLPVLSEAPWPPPFPEEFDKFCTQEQAARYVVATTDIVVAPRSESVVRRESVVFEQLSETVNNVIWLPAPQYEELALDVGRLLAEERSVRGELRLSDLEGRPLARFLENELPLAVLSEYQREILKLPSGSAP